MDELEEGAVCGTDGCAPAPSKPAQVPGSASLDIAIVSDAICPWCYVGKRRFEKALALLGPGIPVRVTWHAFELNPTMPKGGVERDAYRMQKFGSLLRSRQLDAQIAAAGAGEGIAFRHDLMARTPNTFDAHRLIWFANVQGKQDAVVETLFRGYFSEGRDIGDLATLAELAAQSGLDGDVPRFLHGAEGAEDVRHDLTIASQAGISGVPTFIANGYLLCSGAQPPEAMAAALLQIADGALAPASV